MSNKPNPVIIAFIEALHDLNVELKRYDGFNNNLTNTHWSLPPLSINEILKSITDYIKIAKEFNYINISPLERTNINLAVEKIKKLNSSIQYFPSIENNFNSSSSFSNSVGVYIQSTPILYSIALFVIWLDKNVGSIFQKYEIEQIKTQLNEDLEKGIAAEWQTVAPNALPKNLRTKLDKASNAIEELLPDIDKIKQNVKQELDELIPNRDELKEKIRLINEAKETADELPQNLATLKNNQEKVTQYRETVESDHKAIEILKTEIEQLRNELKNTQAAHETELSTQKEELRKKQEAYFEDIKQHFSVEHKKIAQERVNFGLHVVNQQKKAAELLKQAEETLGISTTVSLSQSFNDKAKELRDSVKPWVNSLIGVLIAGAVLSYWRFDSLIETLKVNPQWEVVTMQIVVALLSLGAPLWFSWLATKQISHRFRLAEDYGFKASVALAYEGYKREAEKLGDDNALKQRLFNAALTRLEESPLRLLETQKSDNGNMPWLTMSDVKELWKKAPDTANALFTQIKEAKDLISKDKSSEKKETPKETTKSDKKDE